jgi:hypothetical protein
VVKAGRSKPKVRKKNNQMNSTIWPCHREELNLHLLPLLFSTRTDIRGQPPRPTTAYLSRYWEIKVGRSKPEVLDEKNRTPDLVHAARRIRSSACFY